MAANSSASEGVAGLADEFFELAVENSICEKVN
jgi:hypothetical protein